MLETNIHCSCYVLSAPCIHVPSSDQQASAVQTFRLVEPVHQVGPECLSPRVLGVWGEAAELSQSLITRQRLADLAGLYTHKEQILLISFITTLYTLYCWFIKSHCDVSICLRLLKSRDLNTSFHPSNLASESDLVNILKQFIIEFNIVKLNEGWNKMHEENTAQY